jgi:GT2 family glycosyltransferase
MRQVKHLPSCNVIYNKYVFQKLHGFRDMRYGEDVDFNHRLIKASYKLMFCPKAICVHYPPATLKQFLKKMYHYGFAQGRLVRQYGIFRKIQIIPFITLVLIATLVIWMMLKIFPSVNR